MKRRFVFAALAALALLPSQAAASWRWPTILPWGWTYENLESGTIIFHPTAAGRGGIVALVMVKTTESLDDAVAHSGHGACRRLGPVVRNNLHGFRYATSEIARHGTPIDMEITAFRVAPDGVAMITLATPKGKDLSYFAEARQIYESISVTSE